MRNARFDRIEPALSGIRTLRKLCITPPVVCLAQGPLEKIQALKQATLNLDLSAKKTRKQVFLDQMDQVVPWAASVELIAPYHPGGKTSRSPFSWMTMLRIHFMHGSNGVRCLTLRWKRPSFTFRCTGSLPSWKSLVACPMSPPFRDLDTGWSNTNWSNKATALPMNS